MKTIRTKVYQFNELSKAAKQTVLEQMREINVQFDWWFCTYEDAEQAGLKLTEHDTDSASFVRDVRGEFINSAPETMEYILDNHGKHCETYKTALKYKNQFALTSSETNEDELEAIEDAFLDELLMDYTKMLQEQLEYEYSDKAVIDTIESNEYYFTKDGKRFNY